MFTELMGQGFVDALKITAGIGGVLFVIYVLMLGGSGRSDRS